MLQLDQLHPFSDETIFDVWGLSHIPWDPSVEGPSARVGLVKMANVNAPFHADAFGVREGELPPQIDPSFGATINLKFGDAGIDIAVGDAVRPSMVREFNQPGKRRSIYAVFEDASNSIPRAWYKIDYETQRQVQSTAFEASFDPGSVNQQISNRVGNWTGAGLSTEVVPSVHVGESTFVIDETAEEGYLPSGFRFFMTGTPDNRLNNQFLNWGNNGVRTFSTPADASLNDRPVEDRIVARSVCQNDAEFLLCFNPWTRELFRVAWPPTDTRGSLIYGRNEPGVELIGSLPANLDPEGNFWCYQRFPGREVEEVFLYKESGSGASHYWDGSQVVESPTDNATYITVGPDGEIVYGSSRFIERLGEGGWKKTWTYPGTSRDPWFAIYPNRGCYQLRAAHVDRDDITGERDFNLIQMVDGHLYHTEFGGNPSSLLGEIEAADVSRDGSVVRARRTRPHIVVEDYAGAPILSQENALELIQRPSSWDGRLNTGGDGFGRTHIGARTSGVLGDYATPTINY